MLPGFSRSLTKSSVAGSQPEDMVAALNGTQDSSEVEQAIDAFISKLESSMFVVTTVDEDGELSGCLVGFGTQCSIEPTRFLVCLSKVNHTYSVARRSHHLAVHLLGEQQIELASLFGERTGDTVSKFDRCRWHPGRSGVPILSDCAAWIEGQIMDRFDVGDHEAISIQPLGGGSGRTERVLTSQRLPSLSPGHPIPD